MTSPPATSPRRAACSTSTGRSSSGSPRRCAPAPRCPAVRSTRRPDLFLGAVENPGAPAARPPGRAERPRRSPPAPASCSSRSRIAPISSRRSWPRRARARRHRALRDPADHLPRARRSRAALHGRAGARHLRAGRRRSRGSRAVRRPARRPTSSALEQARHALAQPGVAGIHLTSFRRDNAIPRLCETSACTWATRTPVRSRWRHDVCASASAAAIPLITSELVPPRGADAASVHAQVATLAFADALNVTDLPRRAPACRRSPPPHSSSRRAAGRSCR